MNDLKIIEVDPVSSQNNLLKFISEKGLELVDPTNPFTMMLEANAITSTNIIDELIAEEQTLFPVLARNKNDLYPHIVDGDEEDLFATPATTFIRCLISIESLVRYGVTENEIYYAVIPKNSYIVVDNVYYTIMNDVKVSLNSKGDVYRSFVENILTDTSIAFKGYGNTISNIRLLKNNETWIEFNIPVKQVRFIQTISHTLRGNEFNVTIPIEDQYYRSIVEHYKDNEWQPLFKYFARTKYNPEIPSVYVEVMNKEVQFRIPQQLIDKDLIGQNIRITIYTTRGKLTMPLNRYQTADFKYNISPIGPTPSHAAGSKLNFIFYSKEIVDGGISMRDTKELKTKIVNRLSNTSTLPITEMQLKEKAKLNGFIISKYVDTLLNRLYIAHKDINSYDSNFKYRNYSYLYSNTTVINAGTNNPQIVTDERGIIIKPNTLFNDNSSIISQLDTSIIDNLEKDKKKAFLNKNKILFNPFHYIIDNVTTATHSRVYDIDKPSFELLTIKRKNEFLMQNVNITGIEIFRDGDGYDIFFNLYGNDDFTAIDDDVFIQLGLPISENEKVYFVSEKNEFKTGQYFQNTIEAPLHYIRVDSTLYIDKDDKIEITNSLGDMKISMIDTVINAELIIFYRDDSIIFNNVIQSEAREFLGVDNEMLYRHSDKRFEKAIGITEESVELHFAENLDYLWAKCDTAFTDRKYKQYNSDVYLRYDHDKYDCVKVDKNNKWCKIDRQKLYSVGELVVDEDGNPIIKHRKGDFYLDENGEPIIDNINGRTYLLDILMLDFKYLAFKKTEYLEQLKFIKDIILKWLRSDMVEINEITLDQTIILYKSYRTNGLVITQDCSAPKTISPTVTLFFNESLEDGAKKDRDSIYDTVGRLLNKYFSKSYIVIEELEDEIRKEIGDTIAVKIEGYLKDNPKLVALANGSNRFEIKKKITASYDVIYDYKLELKYL